MGDEYAVGDEDGLPADLIMVRNAIACEIYAQLALRSQAIRHEDISGVAYALTTMLDRSDLLDHYAIPRAERRRTQGQERDNAAASSALRCANSIH